MAAAIQDATRPIREVFGNQFSFTPERAPGFIYRAAGNIGQGAYGSG
jgi:hypothetical protein